MSIFLLKYLKNSPCKELRNSGLNTKTNSDWLIIIDRIFPMPDDQVLFPMLDVRVHFPMPDVQVHFPMPDVWVHFSMPDVWVHFPMLDVRVLFPAPAIREDIIRINFLKVAEDCSSLIESSNQFSMSSY